MLATLEADLAVAMIARGHAAPRAVRDVARAFGQARALDLALALGFVAAGLDRPTIVGDPRDTARIGACYRCHAALAGDIAEIHRATGPMPDCAALLGHWDTDGDVYVAA